MSKIKCEKCNGERRVPKPCNDCGRTGKRKWFTYDEDGEHFHEKRCSSCKGNKSYMVQCSTCTGIGWIYKTTPNDVYVSKKLDDAFVEFERLAYFILLNYALVWAGPRSACNPAGLNNWKEVEDYEKFFERTCNDPDFVNKSAPLVSELVSCFERCGLQFKIVDSPSYLVNLLFSFLQFSRHIRLAKQTNGMQHLLIAGCMIVTLENLSPILKTERKRLIGLGWNGPLGAAPTDVDIPYEIAPVNFKIFSWEIDALLNWDYNPFVDD